MKKKISLSTEYYQKQFGDLKAIEIAAKLGYDAVDFSTMNDDYRNIESPFSKTDQEIYGYYHSLYIKAKKLGIEIGQTHGRLVGFTLDENENKAVVENARRDCLAASALHAPYVVMHSVGTGRVGIDVLPQVMRDLNFKMFQAILPFSKKYDVNIAIETFGDSPRYQCLDFFGDPIELLNCYERLCKELNCKDRLSLCVDTGHCNKANRFVNAKPSDVIRLFGNRISTLHLNDNDGLTDQHKPPRTGNIDWDDVMKALEEINYQGTYNMELNLDCFGENIIDDTALFSRKIMNDLLNKKRHD